MFNYAQIYPLRKLDTCDLNLNYFTRNKKIDDEERFLMNKQQINQATKYAKKILGKEDSKVGHMHHLKKKNGGFQ